MRTKTVGCKGSTLVNGTNQIAFMWDYRGQEASRLVRDYSRALPGGPSFLSLLIKLDSRPCRSQRAIVSELAIDFETRIWYDVIMIFFTQLVKLAKDRGSHYVVERISSSRIEITNNNTGVTGIYSGIREAFVDLFHNAI